MYGGKDKIAHWGRQNYLLGADRSSKVWKKKKTGRAKAERQRRGPDVSGAPRGPTKGEDREEGKDIEGEEGRGPCDHGQPRCTAGRSSFWET